MEPWDASTFQMFAKEMQVEWDRRKIKWFHGRPEWFKKMKSDVLNRAEKWNKMKIKYCLLDLDIYTTISNEKQWMNIRER